MKSRIVAWGSIIECSQERTKHVTGGVCTTLNFIRTLQAGNSSNTRTWRKFLVLVSSLKCYLCLCIYYLKVLLVGHLNLEL